MDKKYGVGEYKTDYLSEYKKEYKTDYQADYKTDYKTDYKADYKTEYKNESLGDSKYLKDYASNEYNEDDALIVFNTKKVDIGGRDSLGYKAGTREDNYDEYRKLLKNDRYDTKY